MGLLSLFNDKPSTTGAVTMESLEETEDIWRHAPFASFAAGGEMHAVYLRERVPVLIPSYVVDFAERCTEFRPLAEHIARHAERQAWGSAEIEALRSWMRRVREVGMFVSRGEVVARAAASGGPAATPAPITALGFSTGGDRLEMVTRTIHSFVENVRAHGRTADFIVADSSPHPAHRGRLRQQTGELTRDLDLPVRYLGEPEKRRLAEEIARRSGCRPEAVEFGLFDVHGAGSPDGTNRNALLLHEAGGVFSTVNDEVLCEFAAGPAGESRLALFSDGDPYERWVFDDRAGASARVTFETRDFLAEQEKVLGRDLGALLQGMRGEEVEVARVGVGLLRLLERGPARVRATFLGYAGEPGAAVAGSAFFHRGCHHEHRVETEESFHAGRAGRSALARVAAPSLGDDSVSSGLAMGLDHRELLPPFFPVLAAEEMVFHTAAWRCCAGFISGHLPLAVRCDMGANPSRRPSGQFAQVVRAILAEHPSARQEDTATRLQKLGRYLVEYAARPAADFREALQHVVLAQQSRQITALEQALRTETDAPEFWRHDRQEEIDRSRATLEQEDFDIPPELKAGRTTEENRDLMQKLIRGYGLLLEDWPGIVSAARDLRKEGVCFSAMAVGE